MRFEYFSETDMLYIQLQAGPGVDAQEVAPDIVFDFNAAGEVIGIEIEHASERTDLMNLQMSSFPIRAATPRCPSRDLRIRTCANRLA